MAKLAYKTRQQELLLSYLSRTQGSHFTADDVRAYFNHKNIQISLATIYRQLEKFVAGGSVHKYFIDEHSAACYEYSGETCTKLENHFHLKCEKCGKLIHLECGELSEIGSHLKNEHGFSLNPLRTVFYGVCADCAKCTEEKTCE